MSNASENAATGLKHVKRTNKIEIKQQHQKAARIAILEAVKTCTKAKDLERSKAMHLDLFLAGYTADAFVTSSLINMYSKCASMVLAHRVFNGIQHHDTVSWNSLIMGYAENGDGNTALELFNKMQCDGCAADTRTFLAVLKACTTLASNEEAEQIAGKFVKVKSLIKGMAFHTEAAELSFASNPFVGSILVDMYAKCGSMERAREAFDRTPEKDVVSWNSLILGYADNRDGTRALQMLSRMRDQGFVPDPQTYVGAVKACSIVGALDTGRALHAEICSRGFQNNVILATSLIDLYAKCWSMTDAHKVFDALKRKDSVTWTALLYGYNHCGDTAIVFSHFDLMLKAKLKPNRVTFLCVLSACCHAGLVDKGREYFEMMSSKFNIHPDIEHYSCMIDMLGRANKLDDAVKMVRSMPFEPSAVTWMVVLDACKKWKNVEVGKLAFRSLLSLDPEHSAAYLSLMANIME